MKLRNPLMRPKTYTVNYPEYSRTLKCMVDRPHTYTRSRQARMFYNDRHGYMKGRYFLTFVLLASLIFVATLVVGSVTVSRHYARVACNEFEIQASRETKFVNYHYFAWDCLTPTKNDKWIGTALLRDDADD